jgi:hypothetical protein
MRVAVVLLKSEPRRAWGSSFALDHFGRTAFVYPKEALLSGRVAVLRAVGLAVAILALGSLSPVSAQVMQQDESLQEQLVPESFTLEASAIASKFNWWWSTTVSYAVTNHSGMNLYLGIMQGGVTFGSCTDAEEIRGALQFLPSPHATAYSVNPMQGPPRGAFVPAGARASGAIVLTNCATPNPGFPTAPLSISLMVGKSEAFRTMTTFPLNVDAPIRMLQSQ